MLSVIFALSAAMASPAAQAGRMPVTLCTSAESEQTVLLEQLTDWERSSRRNVDQQARFRISLHTRELAAPDFVDDQAIGETADVQFFVKSTKKYNGKTVSFNDYMDEEGQGSLYIGGKRINYSCRPLK